MTPVSGDARNLLLAGFCLETALFYGLAAALRKQGWNIYLTTLMLCGAIWQLLSYFHTPSEFYPLAFALLGLALLVAYRLALLERLEWTALSRAGFYAASELGQGVVAVVAKGSGTVLIASAPPEELRRLIL